MTQLHWYPHSPKKWREICRGLSFEERGALKHVLDESWERTPPCTIADTVTELQMLLGHRWRKLSAVIRQHFTPDIEHPGRLRCDWLAEMHREQTTKYESAAKRGGEGGRTKSMNQGGAARRKQRDLFKTPADEPQRSPATSPATLAEPEAQLPQMLEGSSALRAEKNPAAVAFAGGAPAPAAEDPGPDFDWLRAWADADPAIAAAVKSRVDQLSQHIPVGVQVPTLRHAHELEALQAEFTARQAGEAL